MTWNVNIKTSQAPKGPFMVTMRLYWPKSAALNDTWKLPPLKRVQ